MPDAPEIEITSTLEAGNIYENINTMLPRGDSMVMVRRRIFSHKRDNDGNPVGTANANPILDSQQYEVKFEDREVTKLTAHVIAESMYVQCNPEGNHASVGISNLGIASISRIQSTSRKMVERNLDMRLAQQTDTKKVGATNIKENHCSPES